MAGTPVGTNSPCKKQFERTGLKNWQSRLFARGLALCRLPILPPLIGSGGGLPLAGSLDVTPPLTDRPIPFQTPKKPHLVGVWHISVPKWKFVSELRHYLVVLSALVLGSDQSALPLSLGGTGRCSLLSATALQYCTVQESIIVLYSTVLYFTVLYCTRCSHLSARGRQGCGSALPTQAAGAATVWLWLPHTAVAATYRQL